MRGECFEERRKKIFTMNLFCRKKLTNKKNKNTQKKESHTSSGHSVSDNLVRTRSEGRNSTEFDIQRRRLSLGVYLQSFVISNRV